MTKVLRLSGFAICIALALTACTKQSEKQQTKDESSDILEIANQRGDVGGQSDGGGVTLECTSCTMSYPDNSNLPRSGAIFNESDVLVASEPGANTCGTLPGEIKVWYNDEHALTLGVRQVIVVTRNGTTTTNYPITPTPATVAIVNNPLVGTTASSGDNTGDDEAVGGGRPLWPALFITDITDDESKRTGDWQQGGIGIPPTRIAGTWKGAVRKVDKTKTPTLVTIIPDANPRSNAWNLAGAQAPPAGVRKEGYSALVAWDINSLGLKANHKYRVQFMVHDGDQNKDGGDVGQSCTTIIIPRNKNNYD